MSAELYVIVIFAVMELWEYAQNRFIKTKTNENLSHFLYRCIALFKTTKSFMRCPQYDFAGSLRTTRKIIYIESALLIINPTKGKRIYTENEIFVQWQHFIGTGWIDVSEPNFIDTNREDYRLVFKTRATESPYQARVESWLLDCFGLEVAENVRERCLRFLEEAIELVQALDLPIEDAHRLVSYTYGRSQGEAGQEVGGVMVTLASLCGAAKLNLEYEAELEYKRILKNIDKIRDKQQFKKQQNITAT